MTVRIFKPARTAMQSGTAKADRWILEFDSTDSKRVDPLMGWTGSANTQTQVRLLFENKQDAIDYAERKGLVYVINENQPRKLVIRKNGYGDNFATDRRTSWTH
tara:strand:- start:1570 stop:1881 length:312 start_codon:yes stop_codon:yes gene_type:complete